MLPPPYFTAGMVLAKCRAVPGFLQSGCHVYFTEAWVPSAPSTIQTWLATEMAILLEGSHFSTEQCWSPVRGPAVGRVLLAPNSFIMEATVLIRAFNTAELFCSLSQICALIQSCLRGPHTTHWTLWLSLCSDMGPYTDRGERFQIMSS